MARVFYIKLAACTFEEDKIQETKKYRHIENKEIILPAFSKGKRNTWKHGYQEISDKKQFWKTIKSIFHSSKDDKITLHNSNKSSLVKKSTHFL